MAERRFSSRRDWLVRQPSATTMTGGLISSLPMMNVPKYRDDDEQSFS
jgi:hypothetical protein